MWFNTGVSPPVNSAWQAEWLLQPPSATKPFRGAQAVVAEGWVGADTFVGSCFGLHKIQGSAFPFTVCAESRCLHPGKGWGSAGCDPVLLKTLPKTPQTRALVPHGHQQVRLIISSSLLCPCKMLWRVLTPLKHAELPLFSFITLQQRVGDRICSLDVS